MNHFEKDERPRDLAAEIKERLEQLAPDESLLVILSEEERPQLLKKLKPQERSRIVFGKKGAPEASRTNQRWKT